jgi:hypothetical protein
MFRLILLTSILIGFICAQVNPSAAGSFEEKPYASSDQSTNTDDPTDSSNEEDQTDQSSKESVKFFLSLNKFAVFDSITAALCSEKFFHPQIILGALDKPPESLS